jgi:2,3-bisphosphoglycerate-independent phosphoglycerate mutase
MKISKPVVMVILDGWGEWDIEKGNPLKKAKMPTIERLNNHYPKTYLQASGMAVGLPWGVRGNSEVGHQTIGSGQIIFQYLPTISTAIGEGSFFKNQSLLSSFDWVKQNNSDLHVVGLLSDGAVHSHIDHLFAFLEMAKNNKAREVFIHVITDGRDTHPQSARNYLAMLKRKIQEIGIGQIATISGRHYAMDRNNNWDRTKKSFLAMTAGEGNKALDTDSALDEQYGKQVFDEYLEPVVMVTEDDRPIGLVKDNDAMVCFNFRKDRSRQITKAFVMDDIYELRDVVRPKNIKYVCFTQYEEGLPVEVAFAPQDITVRLGEVLSKNWKRQLRIAETEKYAHVTYFFNGGVEQPYFYEDRVLVPSKKVSSYIEAPEMSAAEVTDKLLDAIEKHNYDFILVNYANSDMVGHTGNFEAAVKSVEFVDSCLERVMEATIKKGGQMIITADHGNVEEMLNVYTGEPDTQHSKNPVPCWYVSVDSFIERKTGVGEAIEAQGMLVDLAPTVLELLGIEKPVGMIGHSLMDQLDPAYLSEDESNQ